MNDHVEIIDQPNRVTVAKTLTTVLTQPQVTSVSVEENPTSISVDDLPNNVTVEPQTPSVTVEQTVPSSVDINVGASGLRFSWDETPSGVINGSNQVFTLINAPNPSGSLALFLNGLKQQPGIGNDYVASGASLTMSHAPSGFDVLSAIYTY